MGRAKLNMELISKEKAKNITFKKRKENLMKKIEQFSILCDVKACMIIYYGPKPEKGASEAEIWPENVEQVGRMIDIYKAKSKDSGCKTFGLPDFFHDRKRKIEEELSKLRRRNMEAKYPTWLELMNSFTEVQLRDFAANLGVKVEFVRRKIDCLKKNKEILDVSMMDFGLNHQSQGYSFCNQRGGIAEVLNQQAFSSLKPIELHVPDVHNHHQVQAGLAQEVHSLNQNSMMMFLLNDNDHRVAPTSGNISFKQQLIYESTTKLEAVDPMNPMVCQSPRSLACLYVPPPMAPPPYMIQPHLPVMAAPPPSLPFFSKDNFDQEDNAQYQMNSRAI